MIAVYSNSNPKIYGGVEVLVLRFAKFLKNRGIDFVVIEPKGTLLYSQLDAENLISPEKIESVASRIENIFFPNVSKVRHVDSKFECLAHAKFTAWIVHPNEPFRSFMPYSGKFLEYAGYKGVRILRRAFPSNYSAAFDFFSNAIQKKSVLTMDAACSRALKYFYPLIRESPSIIPIPSEISDQIDAKTRIWNNLSVAYFGRLDEFKASALLPIVSNQLATLANKRRIVLHIFGDGPCLNRIAANCQSNRIGVEVHGYLPNNIARHKIRINTDFAIAMGTAALDIAATGHPCIYIDPALSRFAKPQTKFRFVDQTENYVLGEYRDFPGYVAGTSDFSSCINRLQNESCGISGRDYVMSKHDVNVVYESLLLHMLNSKATLSEFLPNIFDINEKFAMAKRLF